MGNLLYLAIAAGIFVVGSILILLRHRERPMTFGSSIERFQHEMGALNPRRRPPSRGRGGPRRR